MILKGYPAVKLLLAFVLFIIPVSLINTNSTLLYSIALIALIVATALFLLKKNTMSYLLAALTLSLVFLARLNDTGIQFGEIPTQFNGVFQGKIAKIISSKAESSQFVAEGTVYTNLINKPIRSKIIVSAWGGKVLDYGSSISFDGKFETPSNPNLPGEFNQAMFAKSHGATFLINLKTSQIKLVAYPGYSASVRNNIISYIAGKIDTLYSERSGAVMKALLLGDRSRIDSGTKQEFSLSGTAHVLAVSGLHVGIIASIIFLLMAPINSKWLKFCIFTILLILFVIISGFQPSAIRAGAMAISILFLLNFERKPELINILAGVVLLSLILVPDLLFSAGFQMSVFSVVGIALFYKPLYHAIGKIVKSDNKIFNFVRGSVSVTLAASITVSPLIAAYFGTVSLISLVTNLFVIPMMSLSLVFGVLCIISSTFWFVIGGYFANTSQLLIECASWLNHKAIQLPGAFIEGDGSIALSIIISISLLYLITYRNNRMLIFRLVTVLIVSGMVIALFPKLEVHEDTAYIKIVPRKYFTAVEIHHNNRDESIYLSDRTKGYNPGNDYAFLKYVALKNGNIRMYADGDKGIEFCDKLKSRKKIGAYSVDSDIESVLVKKLSLHCQLNEIKQTLNYE